jgi:ubiquinone/menaquinone biosynthesis C-methylase UbiE
MHDRRFPAAQAQKLEDPARLEWLPPAEVLALLNITPGEIVADIGAGTGYFALPMARLVGSSGRVVAVDAQQEMLEWISRKMDAAGVSNIQLVHAEAEATTLPGASCDVVFMANVWHEFPSREAVLQEAARILKPRGRLAILDWRPDVERIAGPPLDHRLSVEDCTREMEHAFFSPQAMGNIGQFSWMVVASRE